MCSMGETGEAVNVVISVNWDQLEEVEEERRQNGLEGMKAKEDYQEEEWEPEGSEREKNGYNKIVWKGYINSSNTTCLAMKCISYQ